MLHDVRTGMEMWTARLPGV